MATRRKGRGDQGPRRSIVWCLILSWRKKQAKIVMGADLESLGLGWAHQQDLCISINNRYMFFSFYFNVVAFTSPYTSISPSCHCYTSIYLSLHSYFLLLSFLTSISSLLIWIVTLDSNFYLDSKRNSKLVLAITSKHFILTRASLM